MGFNSAFKGLKIVTLLYRRSVCTYRRSACTYWRECGKQLCTTCEV